MAHRYMSLFNCITLRLCQLYALKWLTHINKPFPKICRCISNQHMWLNSIVICEGSWLYGSCDQFCTISSVLRPNKIGKWNTKGKTTVLQLNCDLPIDEPDLHIYIYIYILYIYIYIYIFIANNLPWLDVLRHAGSQFIRSRTVGKQNPKPTTQTVREAYRHFKHRGYRLTCFRAPPARNQLLRLQNNLRQQIIPRSLNILDESGNSLFNKTMHLRSGIEPPRIPNNNNNNRY